MSEHVHYWKEYERTHSVTRFRCADCSSLGYRSTIKPSQAIREYKKPPPAPQAEVTARPRSCGSNATGGYLPGGSSGIRR